MSEVLPKWWLLASVLTVGVFLAFIFSFLILAAPAMLHGDGAKAQFATTTTLSTRP